MPKKMSNNKSSNKGKKSGKPGPKKGGASAKAGNSKKLWEWANFTTKSVSFNKEAKALAQLISETYGDGVTITQFEKMVAAFPSMSEDRKGLIFVTDELIAQFEKFKSARDTRDTERDSFRGDVAVANVEGGLEALRDRMSE